MSNDLLFESVEAYLEWIFDDSRVVVLYTKLNETGLNGFAREGDVMPREYAIIEEYSEAAIEESDESRTTFVLIPIQESVDTPHRYFRANNSEEAEEWVRAINNLLTPVPLAEDDEGMPYEDEANDEETYRSVDDRNVSPSNSNARAGLAQPTASNVSNPAAISRLQPLLDDPARPSPRPLTEQPDGLTYTPRPGQQPAAIRTTTVTTHDEYRQGGVPPNRYEETDAWVRGTNNMGPSDSYARQTSGTSGAGTGGGGGGGGWGGQSTSSAGDARPPLRQQDHNNVSYTQSQSQSPIHPSSAKHNTTNLSSNATYGPANESQSQNTVIGRKRSGMFVNVPSNQQLNRNVAPNVSAMWKQWTDETSGDVYVFHEPTGTLQCRPAGSNIFETYMKGSEEIPEEDLASHPFAQEDDTLCDMNGNVIRNLQNYGTQRFTSKPIDVTSSSVYRTDAVVTPRGQYSPTRKSRVSVQAAPREPAIAYEGRRVHHVSILAGDTPEETVVEHTVEPLDTKNLVWDPRTGKTIDISDRDGTNARNIGQATLYKQWEHIRGILMQGRYFKKHAVNKSTFSYRFAFLTGDNAYVVCVPTSEVMLNVHTSVRTFNNVSDTVQYYGRDAKAIAVNNITRVSLGTEEASISRRKDLKPQNTFCIVTRTHAFILECETRKEATYFADAWNFFLHHSSPMNLQAMRTKEMLNPVTHGTRAGLAF